MTFEFMTLGGYIRELEDFSKYISRGVTKIEIRIHKGGHRGGDLQPRFGMAVYEMERPGWKPRAFFSDAFHPTSEPSGEYMSETLLHAFNAQEYLKERGVEAQVVVRGVPVDKSDLGDLIEKLGPETQDPKVAQWYHNLIVSRNGKT